MRLHSPIPYENRPTHTRLVLTTWLVVTIAWIAATHLVAGPGVGSLAPLAPDHDTLRLIGVLAVVAGMANAAVTRRSLGSRSLLARGAYLIALAPVPFGMGSLARLVSIQCADWGALSCPDPDTTFPHPADALFLLLYVLLIAGATLLLKASGGWRQSRRLLLATAVPPLAIGTFAAVSVLPFDSVSISITATAYIAGDASVLWLATILLLRMRRIRGGRLFLPAALMVASMFTIYVGDLAFLSGTAASSSYDTAYICGLSMLAVGTYLLAVRARMRTSDAIASAADNVSRASAVIDENVRLLGRTAHDVARSVPGVDLEEDGSVRLHGDEQRIIEDLVDRFTEVSGELGRMASIEALDAGGGGEAATQPRYHRTPQPTRHGRLDLVLVCVGVIATWAVVAVGGGPGRGALAGAIVAAVALAWGYRAVSRERDHLEAVNHSLADLARSLDTARSDERRRLAWDLHDLVMAQLLHAELHLRTLGSTLEHAGSADDLQAELGRAQLTLSIAHTALRRIMLNVEPVSLYHGTVALAVDELAREWGEQSGVVVDLDLAPLNDLPLSLQLLLYRIVVEALTNIERHAHATLARISLQGTDDNVELRVTDNGRGFAIRPFDDDEPPASTAGWGLRLVAEQVRLAGGRMDLQSEPGQGTTLSIRLPTQPIAPSIIANEPLA